MEQLSSQCRKRIIDSQRDAWNRYGYHPNALYWSSQKIQHLRFEILTRIGVTPGDAILDVGCGFGDFAIFLADRGKPVCFTGIDLSEELLNEGHRRYPHIELIHGDLFDLDPATDSFDHVTLSGALNRNLEDDGAYALQVIRRMFETCRKGIAFNLLDVRHEWTAGRSDLQSFQPERIRVFVSEFADRVEIVDDYLENDFTVLAWKN